MATEGHELREVPVPAGAEIAAISWHVSQADFDTLVATYAPNAEVKEFSGVRSARLLVAGCEVICFAHDERAGQVARLRVEVASLGRAA